ncbi:MAG: cytochrome c oxidase subunit 3 family protein [Gammaproteobacteria bacterium]|nr:cytochrome c oxidase subunit 3 family protein [Gammaproteobacteria bacterium]
MQREPHTTNATATTAAPGVPTLPGNRGIWVGILAEMTEFGLLFMVYFIARAHHPEAFMKGPGELHTEAGMINTLLMISGSFCVAKATFAVRRQKQRLALRWLAGVGVAIVGYLLIKYLEITWNIAHGVVGTAGVFYAVYYYLTFTHMVHIVWGGMGLTWIIFRTAGGAYHENHQGLESFALYWHATDLAWLIIFPLIYLLR